MISIPSIKKIAREIDEKYICTTEIEESRISRSIYLRVEYISAAHKTGEFTIRFSDHANTGSCSYYELGFINSPLEKVRREIEKFIGETITYKPTQDDIEYFREITTPSKFYWEV